MDCSSENWLYILKFRHITYCQLLKTEAIRSDEFYIDRLVQKVSIEVKIKCLCTVERKISEFIVQSPGLCFLWPQFHQLWIGDDNNTLSHAIGVQCHSSQLIRLQLLASSDSPGPLADLLMADGGLHTRVVVVCSVPGPGLLWGNGAGCNTAWAHRASHLSGEPAVTKY